MEGNRISQNGADRWSDDPGVGVWITQSAKGVVGNCWVFGNFGAPHMAAHKGVLVQGESKDKSKSPSKIKKAPTPGLLAPFPPLPPALSPLLVSIAPPLTKAAPTMSLIPELPGSEGPPKPVAPPNVGTGDHSQCPWCLGPWHVAEHCPMLSDGLGHLMAKGVEGWKEDGGGMKARDPRTDHQGRPFTRGSITQVTKEGLEKESEGVTVRPNTAAAFDTRHRYTRTAGGDMQARLNTTLPLK